MGDDWDNDLSAIAASTLTFVEAFVGGAIVPPAAAAAEFDCGQGSGARRPRRHQN